MTDPEQRGPEANEMAVQAAPIPGSTSRRAVFFVLGCLCVGLGALGVIIPGLPTTPLLLLAAGCFARASRRAYAWLLGNRVFGPTIRSWHESRTASVGTKVLAVSLILLTLGSTCIWCVDATSARLILGAIGLAVIVWLCSIPSTRQTGSR